MARKYHDKEWLERQYWELEKSTVDIAREVGVVKETIRKWMQRHNIPMRKPGPQKGSTFGDAKNLKDESWLRKEYIEKEKSTSEIARSEGVGQQTVLNWLDNHGIESRDNGDVFIPRSSSKDTRLEDEEWLRGEYQDKGRSMVDIAGELDVTTPAVKYRLDRHGIERRGDSTAFDGGDSEFQRDPNWEDKRERRLEIDNHECQDCGVHEDNYYRSLDVHHLTKKQEFVRDDGSVDWEAANAMKNMVSLCQSCHVKRHTN